MMTTPRTGSAPQWRPAGARSGAGGGGGRRRPAGGRPLTEWRKSSPAVGIGCPLGAGLLPGSVPHRQEAASEEKRLWPPAEARGLAGYPASRSWPSQGRPLTGMSEYPTLDVVKSDIRMPGTIAPPRRSQPPARDPLQHVRTVSVGQLERDLRDLLHQAQPTRSLAELANDGSPRVPSLVAVWLISQVAKAVGRPKLVNLSRVRREELRSIGGVARLVHRTLHSVPSGVKAS